jgi:formylglycine-generating enzyme required for sulfatase activity
MKNLNVFVFSIFLLILLNPCFAGETVKPKESEKTEKTKEAKDRNSDVITNSIGMKLKWIEPGEFMMGSEKGWEIEKPVHNVKVAKGFYIAIYEVTQEQYEKVMGKNPSNDKGANLPVAQVSYNDSVEFCKKLSKKEGKTYRLPTEAEWEYACRAGSKTEYYWGDEFDEKYAWYAGNSEWKTHEVGTKEPNNWGLYDMTGNVWEWCQDWLKYEYPTGGEKTTDTRVSRGGSLYQPPEAFRSAARSGSNPNSAESDQGFRIVLVSEK